MSKNPMAGVPGGQDQPSEEELRAYVTEMRQAHAGEIVAQVVSLLLNGAQVKLGRKDAQMLLDLASSVNEQAGAHLDDEFTGQVSQVVEQLRSAQAEAETELAELLAQGQIPPEQNDLGSPQTAPTDTPPADTAPTDTPRPATPPQGGDAGSRLWTPGG